MDRDVLLTALIVLVCGPVAWGAGPVRPRRCAAGGAAARERRGWRAITLPLVAAAAGLALLVGWALREPDATDERLASAAWLVIAAVLVLWLRALARLVLANLRRPAVAMGVVGLWRPRIVVEPAVACALDAEELAAALAHEEAHRRHRDPLRIALAHLACDLQWPWPQARWRLRAWLEALEEARDDGAVAAGADPAALAAAIIAVARHQVTAGAAALGATAVERRVARLLADEPRPPSAEAGRLASIAIGLVLVAALVAGIAVGDDLLCLLPGVRR